MSNSEFVNELHPQLLSIIASNSFVAYNSKPRMMMYGSHIGQSLVIKEPDISRIQSGLEREFGKYTHKIKFDDHATIIRVIDKYPTTLGYSDIGHNPLKTVIYERYIEHSNSREFDCVNLVNHHCVHQYFGFSYAYNPDVMRRLTPDSRIQAGTVIGQSPSLTQDGDYRYGVQANIALASMPGVIEDGAIISRSLAKRMTPKLYGTRTIQFGQHSVPLNLYGDKDRYKIFPDIGDVVRPDGLLFATRQIEAALTPVTITPESLQEFGLFDRGVYAYPNAKIVDVQVIKGRHEKLNLPPNMATQCEMYYRKLEHYYSTILSVYKQITDRNSEQQLNMSPRFRQLVQEAERYLLPSKEKVILLDNNLSVDEWRVVIDFEYELTPTTGFKLTDKNGAKGVVCEVWEDEDMPVDCDGNRADVIMDTESLIKRMNLGRAYEIYITASANATTKRVREMLTQNPNDIDTPWNYLMEFYRIIAPLMLPILPSGKIPKEHHLQKVVEEGIYLYMPTDNPVEYIKAVRELADKYPAPYGPVTYRGRSGQQVTTKTPILIGSIYLLLLEKIGNTQTAVSSAKLQHYSIPARVSNSDRYAYMGRHNPVRILGESEVRLFAAMCGGEVVADLIDQTNNPQAHNEILYNILRAPKPSDLSTALDRTKIPCGNGRILTLVRHMLECGGVAFAQGDKS